MLLMWADPETLKGFVMVLEAMKERPRIACVNPKYNHVNAEM